MTEFYYKLVSSGKLNIDKVPVKYRDKVKKLMDERG